MKKGKITVILFKDSITDLFQKEIEAWIVNRNFAVHKSVGNDDGFKSWSVTHMKSGVKLNEFSTKKEAIFYAEWVNGLHVPTPWDDVSIKNPGKNMGFILAKDLEYISKWIDRSKEDGKKKARKLGRN